MDYREILYRNYTQCFGAFKEADKGKQFEVYGKLYKGLKLPAEAVVGDLGCGTGDWLLWISKQGKPSRLIAFDVSPSDLNLPKDLPFEIQAGNVLETLKQSEAKFDLLNAKDLFEHFTKAEAVEFLVLCRQALKPGGVLWLSTFNAQSPLSATIRYGDFTHELGVTPISLYQVLKSCGFEIEFVKGYVPVAGGIKSVIRKVFFKILSHLGKTFLALKHGKFPRVRGVDASTLAPDLVAVATRPK